MADAVPEPAAARWMVWAAVPPVRRRWAPLVRGPPGHEGDRYGAGRPPPGQHTTRSLPKRQERHHRVAPRTRFEACRTATRHNRGSVVRNHPPRPPPSCSSIRRPSPPVRRLCTNRRRVVAPAGAARRNRSLPRRVWSVRWRPGMASGLRWRRCCSTSRCGGGPATGGGRRRRDTDPALTATSAGRPAAVRPPAGRAPRSGSEQPQRTATRVVALLYTGTRRPATLRPCRNASRLDCRARWAPRSC